MLIVSKCTQCSRGYTAAVTTCQICGGTCVPVTPEDALRLSTKQAEAAPKPPQAVCPCCDGPAGPHTVAQQTRHQTESTLVPMRRKFLVTTVQVPGVCEACHRRLAGKRWLASILLPLPLIVLTGITVAMDTPAGLAFPVIYIFYVLPRINYAWTDFLLYGRELSWKLTDYVPNKDREALAVFPAGILHIIVRLGLLPALAFALFAVGSFFKKPAPAPMATVAPAMAETPPAPGAAPAKPAAAAKKVPLETGRVFFNTMQAIAVPVNEETIAQPALGHPATSMATISGRSIRVVKVYASEPKIPADVSYQLMTGPTVLEKFSTVPSDGLLVVDWNIFFSPEDLAALTAKMDTAPTPPKAIRIRH